MQNTAICASCYTCLSRAVKICDLDGAYGLPSVKKDELAGDFLFEGRLLSWMSYKCLASAKQGDGFGYIRI